MIDMEVRGKGIGGSEIAAVMGLSPWETPIDVFRRKIGVVSNIEPTLMMEVGTELEGFVLKKYEEKEGVKVLRPQKTFVHPTRPYCLATPDGLVDGQPVGVEAKVVGTARGWGDGPEDVPSHYLLQCLWYARIMSDVFHAEFERWDLTVLIGNRELRTYKIQRNPDLEDEMLKCAENFWREYVEKQSPPPPISPKDVESVSKLYPQSSEKIIVSNSEIDDIVASLYLAHLELIKAKKEHDIAEARVKAVMQDAEKLISPHGIITWKSRKPSSVIEYKALVASLKLDEELIGKFTSLKPGARVFSVPKEWKEEE